MRATSESAAGIRSMVWRKLSGFVLLGCAVGVCVISVGVWCAGGTDPTPPREQAEVIERMEVVDPKGAGLATDAEGGSKRVDASTGRPEKKARGGSHEPAASVNVDRQAALRFLLAEEESIAEECYKNLLTRSLQRIPKRLEGQALQKAKAAAQAYVDAEYAYRVQRIKIAVDALVYGVVPPMPSGPKGVFLCDTITVGEGEAAKSYVMDFDLYPDLRKAYEHREVLERGFSDLLR